MLPWVRFTWKNLKKQKSRAFLGVFGVGISVFLLSCMLILLDSASARYLEYSAQESGNRDFEITYTGPGSPFPSISRTGNDLINLDLEQTITGSSSDERGGIPTSFHYENVTSLLQTDPDLSMMSTYLPRLWTYALVNESERTDEHSEYQRTVQIVGLNYSLEFASKFGELEILENGSTSEFKEQFNQGFFPANSCILLERTARRLGYVPGDALSLNISIPLPANASLNQTKEFREVYYRRYNDPRAANYSVVVNVTVGAIIRHQYKFDADFTNGIVFDLSRLQAEFNQTGRATHLVAIVKEPYSIYNFADVDTSRANVLGIAESIQRDIGFPYEIQTPKLASLEDTQFLSGGFSVIAWFIFAVSGLVAAILIHGILTTSVEERIREFGVLRTLGGRKSLPVRLVFLESALFYLIGTALGLTLAYLAVRFVILDFIVTRVIPAELQGLGFTTVVQPFSILAPFVVGVGISMIVALFPAFKVRRLTIVEAIHPYRHEDKLFQLKPQRNVNWRLIIVGAIFATNGSLLFFLIPHLVVTLNVFGIVAFLVGLLLSFLFGLALVSVGLIPPLQTLFSRIAGAFTRKKADLIKMNIRRHRRRNFNTSLTFCLTFAFIAFLSSALFVVDREVVTTTERNLGADIVVTGQAWNPSVRPLTEEFEQEVGVLDGIERTAPAYASGYDLDPFLSVSVSDFAGILSTRVTPVCVDPSYLDASYSQYLQIGETKMPAGWNDSILSSLSKYEITKSHPLAPIYTGDDACMIAEAIAKSMDVQIGDFIRVIFQRGDVEKLSVRFEIVGIIESFPGFEEFRKLPIQASGAGLLLSPDIYAKYGGLSTPKIINHLAIKVKGDQVSNISKIMDRIDAELGEQWDFWVSSPYDSGFLGVEVSFFLTLINLFGVGFAMFGLISTANSIIVERKKEFAILRTLGLTGSGSFQILYIETLITMSASVVAGSLSGWAVALLLVSQVNLFLQVPTPYDFPWTTILVSWLAGALLLLVGLKLLMRKLQKAKIMEVFRQTVI